MKKFAIVAAVAAATVLSTSACAFWGGSPWSSSNGSAPWNTFADAFGINEVNFNSKHYGRTNGYGYGNPTLYALSRRPASAGR